MVYWITGRKNSGKTTYASALHQTFLLMDGEMSIVLDGDDFRDNVIDHGYSDKGRFKNIMMLAKLAAMLERQNFIVIVACISPRKEWRNKARNLFKESKLIYRTGGELWPGTIYEEPDREELKPRSRPK